MCGVLIICVGGFSCPDCSIDIRINERGWQQTLARKKLKFKKASQFFTREIPTFHNFHKQPRKLMCIDFAPPTGCPLPVPFIYSLMYGC